MDIFLHTELDVGDVVWIPAMCHDYFWPEQATVTEVVYLKRQNSTSIMYCIKDGSANHKISASLCFSTKEKCQEWCNEHN